MIKVLFEDKDIIVALKPSGMPSQLDKTGDLDMLTNLSEQCGTQCHMVHRLDRPVTGLMLFAKNGKIASKFSEENIKKQYLAIICGEALPKECLTHFLIKNQRLNISKVVSDNTSNEGKKAKKAILHYKKTDEINIEPYGKLSKVLIDLVTGRHHQIRVQFSASGLPLWGDTKYNPAFFKTHGFIQIGLASCSLEFKHPSSKKDMKFYYEPENIEPFSFFQSTFV